MIRFVWFQRERQTNRQREREIEKALKINNLVIKINSRKNECKQTR